MKKSAPLLIAAILIFAVLMMAWLYNTDFKSSSENANKYISRLTQRASEQDLKSMHLLALEYEKGKQVERSFRKAIYWHTKAANLGFGNAQADLAKIYSDNEEFRDEALSSYWFKKASENADISVRYNLARHFIDSSDKKIAIRAFKLFLEISKSEEFQHASPLLRKTTMRLIGASYYLGRVTKKDMKLALLFTKQAASEGDKFALYNLARFHELGDGIDKNAVKAGQLYKQAADASLPDAKSRIDDALTKCIDTDIPITERLRNCSISVGAGHTEAAVILKKINEGANIRN